MQLFMHRPILRNWDPLAVQDPCFIIQYHPCMAYLLTFGWFVMVKENVGKYTLHGSYGSDYVSQESHIVTSDRTNFPLPKDSNSSLVDPKGFANGKRIIGGYTVIYPTHMGPPKWMVKIMENPMNKLMIWGFSHYFWKLPYTLQGTRKHIPPEEKGKATKLKNAGW